MRRLNALSNVGLRTTFYSVFTSFPAAKRVSRGTNSFSDGVNSGCGLHRITRPFPYGAAIIAGESIWTPLGESFSAT
ncbi:MAG: hypothetical protein IIY07_05725, partial [Thermoguttaceae bacterium]|nr:hypothetical protein [Thermoguttaceae bacterium]